MAELTIASAGVYRAVLLYRYSACHTGGLQAQPVQLFLVAKSPPTFAAPDDFAESSSVSSCYVFSALMLCDHAKYASRLRERSAQWCNLRPVCSLT